MITSLEPAASPPASIDWQLIGSETSLFGKVADRILEVSDTELAHIARDMAASPSGRNVIDGICEQAETMRMLAIWFTKAERRMLDALSKGPGPGFAPERSQK